METRDPIERLRKFRDGVDRSAMGLHTFVFSAGDIAEIVADLEAQYMKLPVDADGMPIKPGDEMQFGTDAPVRVDSIGTSRCYCGDFGWFGSNGGFYGRGTLCSCRHHVKTDAVEEELARFLTACGDDDPHYYDEQIAEFAERVREIVHANTITNIKSDVVEGIVAEAMSLACEPEAPYSKNSTLVKTYAERIRKAVEHDSRDQ